MQRVWITLMLSWMLAGVAMAGPTDERWEGLDPLEMEHDWLASLDSLPTEARCEALRHHRALVGSVGEEVREALAECPPEALGEATLEETNP